MSVRMRMRMRKPVGLAALTLASTAILITGIVHGHAEARGQTYAPPPPPGFPVKVAIIVPLSGGVESFGEPTRDGALIAIQQAQDVGWDIQTIIADSKCDAQAAISATNKVIFEDQVNYIVGAVCSSASIPMSEIAEANHVLQISPTSTNPQVTTHANGTNKAYVFRACFLDPFQGKVLATVARELGATRAAVLYDVGNAYVKGLAEYFRGSFQELGGSVPVFASYTAGNTDFSGLLTQVANSGADVLFLPDYFGKVNEITEQAQAMGLQITYLGADGWDSPELRLDFLERAYFSTHFWPGDLRKVVVDFVQTYNAAQGTQPASMAALGYDATRVLLQAITEAGVDSASAVKDALSTTSYEGVTGSFTFDEFGDPLKEAAIVKIAPRRLAFREIGDPSSGAVSVGVGGNEKRLVRFVSPASMSSPTDESPWALPGPWYSLYLPLILR